MLERIVERLVAWAVNNAKLVIALSVLLTAAAGFLAATTLTLDTDTTRMISPTLPWKQEQARISEMVAEEARRRATNSVAQDPEGAPHPR